LNKSRRERQIEGEEGERGEGREERKEGKEGKEEERRSAGPQKKAPDLFMKREEEERKEEERKGEGEMKIVRESELVDNGEYGPIMAILMEDISEEEGRREGKQLFVFNLIFFDFSVYIWCSLSSFF